MTAHKKAVKRVAQMVDHWAGCSVDQRAAVKVVPTADLRAAMTVARKACRLVALTAL